MGHTKTTLIASLAATATLACGTAHADRVAAVPQGQVFLPSKGAPSPYRVELVDGSGRQLPTYSLGRRFYILGNAGDRYSVRVHNPTGQRIEAVVSVDGLDVIDGKTADFHNKRGYVVQPYDSITIEGYRTSTSQVATFRFSSVSDSYAGRKGQARNVGVIGVAIFEERAAPAMIHPQPYPYPNRRFGDYRDYLDEEADAAGPRAETRPGRSKDKASGEAHASRKRPAPAPNAGAASEAPADDLYVRPDYPAPPRSRCYDCTPTPTQRPGLGTEFGEGRYSAVTWTRFERRSNTPAAMAELRYNNATGLAALGIYVPADWDSELALRESANPFPGSFATPPASWR